jgi:hypothetical protein
MELLQETRKFDIKGILSKQEVKFLLANRKITNNSHFSYMLNGDSMNIGEHLTCVV